MGWDFCDDWRTPGDVVAMLTKSFESAGTKVLAHGMTRESGESCAWFAVDNPKVGRLAVLALVAKDENGRGYGFKEISEDMGPYYFKVPAKVWNAVKDAPPLSKGAEEWRAKVQPV